MTINCVIAEYNPLHNGHKYLLSESKSLSKADHNIVIMSGDFVQRGEPAVLSKYDRTRSALEAGADLVLQLPVYYSTGSAEFFARGAVMLADSLNCVNTLSFGSESGELSLLQKVAEILVQEPPQYRSALFSALHEGLSFPAAREQALKEYINEPESSYCTLLSNPNDILATEYLKTLLSIESPITPLAIRRIGSSYNDDSDPSAAYPSATALRRAMKDSEKITVDDLSSMLIYKLQTERKKGYSGYLDVNPDLSDKILKNLDHYSSYSDFIMKLKSKNLTYTGLSRALLHILLNIPQNIPRAPLYARVLGCRQDASKALSTICSCSKIPVITNLSDGEDQLRSFYDHSEQLSVALESFQADLDAYNIYDSISSVKRSLPMENEFRRKFLMI